MRVLAFGDSHQGVWNLVAEKLSGHTLDVLSVDGATAYGIMNDESDSGARMVFFSWIATHEPYDVILIGLGEIDCGYFLWTRGEDHIISAGRLISFLHEVSQLAYAPRVVFVEPNPPVVFDASVPNPDYPKRVPVAATLAERRSMTLKLNDTLAKNWPDVLSIWDSVWNPFTGEVFVRYRRSDPLDHHLSWEATAWLWLAELTRVLEEM